jgi:hypothetical protein
MAEGYNFKTLTVQPLAADTVKVYATGTTTLITGLTDLAGNALVNPFTVTQAGGVGVWGFIPPDGTVYDVYWDTQSTYLSKKLGDTTFAPKVKVVSGAYTITGADNGYILDVDADVTLPENATEDLPDNFWCAINNTSASAITVLTEGTDTLETKGSLYDLEQYAGATVIKRGDGDYFGWGGFS